MKTYGNELKLKLGPETGSDTPSNIPLILGLAVLAGGVYVFMKRRSP
jgi:LPXTG-motif cell wall-anchored protein